MQDFAKNATFKAAWEGFNAGSWSREVNVRDFIF